MSLKMATDDTDRQGQICPPSKFLYTFLCFCAYFHYIYTALTMKTCLPHIILILAAVLTTGCRDRDGHTLYQGQKLRAGDVVLRCGSGMTSRAVRMADGRGCYSHVGIAVDSSGVMMIVHAVPDEHDGAGDVDRVKMDAPEVFFSSMRTSNGRIMRHADSIVARSAAEVAQRIYRKGVLFDHDYDTEDTTRMYCSELVEHAYREAAGLSITDSARHDVNLPVFTFRDVILPSDFTSSRHLCTICAF